MFAINIYKSCFICLFLLLTIALTAQQETQYTHFMYNKVLRNPSYAGQRGMPTFTAMYRSQWVGFEGAPVSQMFSFDMPIFRDRGGVGVSVAHSTIGILDKWQASLAYSYRLKINEVSDLRIGMQGSVRHLGVNFADTRLVAIDSDDPSIPNQQESDTNGNFGFGVYYTSKAFFVGFSVPNLNNNAIGFNGQSSIRTAQETPHYYFTAGGMFYIENKLHMKPSLLVKYVENAPIDFDINFGFVYDYKISAGVSYRYGGVTSNFGESLDLLFFYQANDRFGLGVAYDIPLSRIGGLDLEGNKNINAGSIEAMIRYDVNTEKYNKDLPAELESLRRFL